MKKIIEKELGIKGDYQYKAIRSRNFLQANWHSNKLAVLHMLIEKYAPRSILDLGTGSGNFELQMAERVTKIVGVDYNDEALSFLRGQLKKKNIKNVRLVHQDILKPEKLMRLGKFDMIVMIDVIEHLDEKRAEKLIGSFQKLITKGGHVVIITPNYGGLWPGIEKMVDTFTPIPHLENMQHITKYNRAKLRKIFSRGGLEEEYSSTFNTFSFAMPQRKMAGILSRFELSLKISFGNLLLSVFKAR